MKPQDECSKSWRSNSIKPMNIGDCNRIVHTLEEKQIFDHCSDLDHPHELIDFDEGSLYLMLLVC
jgi:hypothetical protein